MVTKIFHDSCLSEVSTSTGDFMCKPLDLYVFPFGKAYAVFYMDASDLFSPEKKDSVLESVKESHFIHLYSHITKLMTITKDSRTALDVYTQKVCPLIRDASGFSFMNS
jgi:hypothetical protein